MATFIASTGPTETTVQDPDVVTLPTGWAAGDLVLIGLYGKYGAPTVTTPSGWTLIQAHTGGVVTTGNDAGNPFMNVYGRVMVAGDTDPSFDYTGTVPNSNGAIALCYRPASGKRWTDRAALGSMPKGTINDATIASPLTGTFTFSPQPNATAGDTLVGFGAVPSDLATDMTSPTITATGLSGGTTTRRQYSESSAGADSAAAAMDRMGFTGTATSATTFSMTFTSVTNMAGPIVGLWLREETIPITTTPVARVSLAPGATPSVRTGHSIKARARKTSSGPTVTLKAALYESTNNRSTDLESTALTTSFAEYTLPISQANATNITSYNDLEIRFWGSSASGDTGALIEVADIWLEAPEAASTPIAGSETHTVGEAAAVAVTQFVSANDTATHVGDAVSIAISGIGDDADFVTESLTITTTFTARTDTQTFTEGAPTIAETTAKAGTDSAALTEGTSNVTTQSDKAANDSATYGESALMVPNISRVDYFGMNDSGGGLDFDSTLGSWVLNFDSSAAAILATTTRTDSFSLGDGGTATKLLGRQTTSGTTFAWLTGGQPGAFQFVASGNGQVTRLWIDPNDPAGTGDPTHLWLGVYTNSGGQPTTLLAQGQTQGAIHSVDSSPPVYADISPVTLVSGTTYWLAILPIGDSFSWNGESDGNFLYSDTMGFSSLPNTYPSFGGGGAAPNVWAETAGSAASIETQDNKNGSDAFTFAEGTSSIVTTDPKAASDSAALSEAAVSLSAGVAVTDIFALGEGPLVMSLSGPSDAHTLSAETSGLQTGAFFTGNETHTATDNVVTLSAALSASDSLTMNDNAAAALAAALTAVEAHTLSAETASAGATNFISGVDSATLNEIANLTSTELKSIADSLTFNEAPFTSGGGSLLGSDTYLGTWSLGTGGGGGPLSTLNATFTARTDALIVNEVVSLATLILKSASETHSLTELADLDEVITAEYIHHLPPLRGDENEYILGGIILDSITRGLPVSATALGVVQNFIAAGIITSADANGQPVTHTASGIAEYVGDAENV